MFSQTHPFASKEIPEGNLFTRIHGSDIRVIQPDEVEVFELIVPYDHAKISCAEIVHSIKSKVNFEVFHPTHGKLNQFGFDVNVGEVYKRESPYDADLFKDLIVKVSVKNEQGSAQSFAVNFILHEVRK
jgi:hypothetical protein